jgi:hypothetical protein
MSSTRKPKWPLLFGGAAGAALVYFFEPGKGSQRRPSVKVPLGPELGSKVVGTVKERVPFIKPDNPNPDDTTLRDRVESEVFSDTETSRASININVVDGIVEIRGEQPTQEAIDQLVARVQGIANVKGVHSYLHLPGTPAPNKESAIRAS